MFKFTKVSLFSVMLSLFAVAIALPIALRDVSTSAQVTSPVAGAEWTVGSQQTVTWDTSGLPVNVTEILGEITLVKSGLLNLIGTLLASNVSLVDGSATITVPNVDAGADYSISLGLLDSLLGSLLGNSGTFSIVPAATS